MEKTLTFIAISSAVVLTGACMVGVGGVAIIVISKNKVGQWLKK